MQVTIIVPDKTVYVDGFAVELPSIDWAKFDGDPVSPWDDIRAVQYDTDAKAGHVEYKTVRTAQLTRPDMTPPDWRIGEADFAAFAWVLPIHEAEKARMVADAEAKRIAGEQAAAEAAAKAEAERRAIIDGTAPAPEAPADVASKSELDALKEHLAKLEADNARLTARVEANEEAAIKTLGGGT